MEDWVQDSTPKYGIANYGLFVDIRGQEIGQYGVCFLLGKRKIKLCGNALFRNKAGVICFFQRLALTWYDVCAVIFFYIKLNINKEM